MTMPGTGLPPWLASRAAPLGRTALALVAGAIGAAVALFLHLPAPLIIGPAIAVTLLTLAGRRVEIHPGARNAVFVVIGTIMGASVTPEVLETAAAWPQSFLLLGASLVAIMWACTYVLQNLFSQGRVTAVLAGTPGHLSFVMSLGVETGGNMAAISIIQSIRLLCLTIIVPAIIALMGYDTGRIPSSGMADMALHWLAGLLALGWTGGWLLARLRMPASYMIGAMALSTASHISGLVEGGVPAWLAMPAYVFMGTLIGSRFSGVTLSDLRRYAVAGVSVTAISVAIAVVFGFIVTALTGLPAAQVQIALAPGGVETMAAMALLMDADPAYVAAHHVLRLFFLTGLIPLFIGRRRRPGA